MTQVVEITEGNNTGSGPGRSYSRRSYRRRPRYRRRRYRRRSFRRRKMTLADVYKLPKFVRAQLLPFDNSVNGVKIPDSNTYPSCPVRADDQYVSITTDANGLWAHAFLPTLKSAHVDHTASDASSWTWSAAYGGGHSSSRQSAVKDSYTLVRTVAHGLKLTCSAAPTSVTGNLHVAVVASTDYGKTTWNFPTSISEMSNAMFYKKYPLAMFTQQTLTVCNKFIDVTATRYMDPDSDGIANATDVDFHNNGWAYILVVLEGCPAATPMISIETVTHLECIPKFTAIDNSSPAAPFSTTILQGSSRISGQVPAAHSDQETQSYFQDIVSAADEGMHAGINNVVGNYIVPAARRVGEYGVYGAFNAGLAYMARRSYGIGGITNYRRRSYFNRY